MKGGSITGNTAYPYDNKANGGGVYCRGRLELSGSPVIEGNKLTTGESNNLVSYSNKTKITDTLNSDAKIYVYMKDTSTQDQTLAAVDPSVSSVDAKNIFYCDNANFVADFDAANKKIKWTTHTHDWGAWTSKGDGNAYAYLFFGCQPHGNSRLLRRYSYLPEQGSLHDLWWRIW